MEERKNAISYQRFSSDRQRNNSSLDRQSDAILNWLKQNPDVDLIDQYIDEAMSGWSGKHIEQGSLGKLLQAIEDGIVKPDTMILVEHFSRLSRQNIEKTEDLLRKIWGYGITIVTIRDNGVYPPSAINDMPLRIRLIIEIEQAFKESEWRSAKVKGSYAKREKEAKNGITPKMRRPFWLNEDGTLNENNTVIKDIFNWYMEGLGQQRIIVRLREKYPTVPSVQKMNPSTVMRWLSSEVVLGKWRGNKVYEAAVDETLFYNVRNVHQSRLYENVKPDRNWPLSGLLQCGVCGRGMSIQKSKGSLPVIRCSSKQRDKSCKRKTTFPYALAHHYMFNTVRKRANRVYTQRTVTKESTLRLGQIENDLVNLGSQTHEMKKLIKDLISQRKTPRSLIEMVSELDEEVAKLEAEREQLQNSIKAQNNLFISEEAHNLVLSPRNFNLEMHKLGFKIVVGEYTLNTTGFDNEAPEWVYRGYCRKKRAYKFNMLGKELYIPTSGFTEEILMLEDKEEV
ncbi:recombinase family protein [Vibrio mediterranei]|uniref:Recombinase family protein n=1 Tax=Vibrio mediterranei TaxID=689 RepID=A0ABX5DKY7_9VIBR|nr:recombinase family protein [Vibrio mediterranei]PCD90065.1 recombinase family protein [Vibrio mediterranei]PRQ69452.1 recombinase family protein [Vibrio mediterranei]